LDLDEDYWNASSSTAKDRIILHFDLDCFYAQAEALRDASLVGTAFGVRQKQIVITTSHEARKRGVPKTGYARDLEERFPFLRLVCGEDLAPYRRLSAQGERDISSKDNSASSKKSLFSNKFDHFLQIED